LLKILPPAKSVRFPAAMLGRFYAAIPRSREHGDESADHQ
jgi:hypothetical protein